MLAGMYKENRLNLLAVVGNLAPAKERAAIARGTLNQIGLSHVPVGIELIPGYY